VVDVARCHHRGVFDHVTIRSANRGASERFYDTVLGAAGIARSATGEGFVEWHDFSLAAATSRRPPTRNLHVGFVARSREAVDAFWRAGVRAGYRSDGAPGPRDYTPEYYGAFLRDPDGNSAEAVHREALRRDGNVDHLWIRVADLDAARRFYELVAPHIGARAAGDDPDRAQFVRAGAGGGTFSLLAGEPTRNLHVAFPAADDATVDAFHAAAVGAGYRDNGKTGERPQYHPGYYGAFVLDPAGTNVEVVNHHRA
jgi:catechol 2,3-dioxygenase-like lactoylglutathione lyase family enzyme